MGGAARRLLVLVRRLDHTVGLLCTVAMALAALALLVAFVIVVYGVAWRYALDRPLTWPDELVGYLLVVLVMLGGADVLRRGEHIGIDLVEARLGPRARHLVRLCGLVAAGVTGTLLILQGAEMVAFSYMVDIRSTGYLAAPMCVVQSLVPIGGGLLLLAALARLAALLVGGREPDPGAEAP